MPSFASATERECPNPRRVFAYCHDSMGIGHLRRTLAICERVSRSHACASFLVATGTPFASLFRTSDKIDAIKLPALSKDGAGAYSCKYLALPLDRLVRCRESLLRQAVEHYAPDIVIVDKAPIGVCGELLPALRWLREHRRDTRVVFGMRDIEDAPETTISQWTQNGVYSALQTYFDEVWVYGMRDLYDVTDRYRIPAAVSEKLRFMGYVARDPCEHRLATSSGAPEVLVTVGGGSDGERLLEAYLSGTARAVADAGGVSTIIGGPDLPSEAAERLHKRANDTAKTRWLDFADCMSCCMRRADVVVSMGGYNTMCEIARHRKPGVVIPREQPRLEQTIRAQLWQRLGVLAILPPEALTAESLRSHLTAALARWNDGLPCPLDLGGLDRVAQRFDRFWGPEPCHAHALCV